MNLPPVKVGDTLILRRLRGKSDDAAVTVDKVGRKWGHAASGTWRAIKFDLTSGYEDSGGYSSEHRVLTPEMDAYEKRITKARGELHHAGVRLDPPLARSISVETIEALVAVIRGAS